MKNNCIATRYQITSNIYKLYFTSCRFFFLQHFYLFIYKQGSGMRTAEVLKEKKSFLIYNFSAGLRLSYFTFQWH